MKKVRTLTDIENDPRVDCVVKNYDGPGCHLVELKEGFTCHDGGSIIANAKTLIDDVNNSIQLTKRG